MLRPVLLSLWRSRPPTLRRSGLLGCKRTWCTSSGPKRFWRSCQKLKCTVSLISKMCLEDEQERHTANRAALTKALVVTDNLQERFTGLQAELVRV